MSVIAQVESELAELRRQEAADGTADLRTSVMTHVVWAPPEWIDAAQRTLAGLAERHPSRTILLVPEPGKKDGIEATTSVRCFAVEDISREVCSEVIELRLRGSRCKAPASIVLPLLISDLPAFCRWRGEPPWGEPQLEQLVDVCDRLVVDSSEWDGVPGAYRRLGELLDRIAVSDIAWSRTQGWRVQLAQLWPGIGSIERLAVTGPQTDALLLVGWLRSRLGRELALEHTAGEAVSEVAVDGQPVEPPPGDRLDASDLLSGELDLFVRDPLYEAALKAAK